MTALLAMHFGAALLAPLLVRWWGRQAFLVLALVPAAAFAWTMAQLGVILDGGEVHESTPWIGALRLDIALRLDPPHVPWLADAPGVLRLDAAADGVECTVDDSDKRLPELLRQLHAADVVVRHVHVREPDLEEVFVELAR